MEKQRLKRILAFVLSLLMMFNSSGIMAYAVPNEGQDPGQQETRERIEFHDATGYNEDTGVFSYANGSVEVSFSTVSGNNAPVYDQKGTKIDSEEHWEVYAPVGATGIRIILTPDEEYTAACSLPEDYQVQELTDAGVLTITGSLDGTTYSNGPLGVSPSFTKANGNPGDPGDPGNAPLEGPCFIDWIEYDWKDDEPDYSTFRLGSDTATYRNDDFYTAIHDERYILLAIASQDGDDIVYTPVTSDKEFRIVKVENIVFWTLFNLSLWNMWVARTD